MRIGDDTRLSDKRVSGWFLMEKARRERGAEPVAPPTGHLPVITLSRQYGSGGHTVVHRLRDLLGESWAVWDKELIEAVARSADVRHEMVEALEERTQSWMTQMIRHMFGIRSLDAGAYKQHLAEVLLALAQQGKKIIVGRGSNFVLKDALNVRIEAALEFRVRATMERLSLSHEAALDLVLRSDRERADFSRGVFDRDVEDRAAYDIVLQTDSLGHDVVATIVGSAARAVFGSAAD